MDFSTSCLTRVWAALAAMMKFSLERLGPNIPKKAIAEWGREIFRNERHASSHIEHRETNTHKIDLLHYVLQL